MKVMEARRRRSSLARRPEETEGMAFCLFAFRGGHRGDFCAIKDIVVVASEAMRTCQRWPGARGLWESGCRDSWLPSVLRVPVERDHRFRSKMIIQSGAT
jgi:hypothetical protein